MRPLVDLLALTTCALAVSASGCRRAAERAAADEGMARIGAATLNMGCEPTRDPTCAPTELPAHAIQVGAFRLDRAEVTQAAYAACVGAGVCTPPAAEPARRSPQTPVTHVTWSQARAYCRWRGQRLPTEAEWELAARGTDGRVYPWGDTPPTCQTAHTPSCGEAPAEAGGRPAGASPFGVLDLAGNVDEWVEDEYAPYGSADAGSGQRVARGGAYDAWHARSTARSALAPDHRDALLGFRCAASP